MTIQTKWTVGLVGIALSLSSAAGQAAAPSLKQLIGTTNGTTLLIRDTHNRVSLDQPCSEYRTPSRNLGDSYNRGGMIICGPSPEPSPSRSAGGGGDSPDPEPVPDVAFEFFDALDQFTPESTDGTVNAYLLSYLSMAVYGPTMTESAFKAALLDELTPLGVEEVDVFMDPTTGADAAVVTLPDAVIVAIRGTSSEGTEGPFADHITDLDAVMEVKEIDDTSVRMHRGFWRAVDSIYDDVIATVEMRRAGGKKVWLTGHSLGGASAMVMSLRFHYDDRIPVQGVHVFGAPRVGSASVRGVAEKAGANNVALADVTERWEMYGDPVTRFPESYKKWVCHRTFVGKCIQPGILNIDYEHFGATNTIEYARTPTHTNYFVDYDSGEIDHLVPPGLSLLGFFDIHMEYQDAVGAEMDAVLEANGDDDILDAMP
ncbi:MAG: lipase family protein [Pseudomonadota bacterium]